MPFTATLPELRTGTFGEYSNLLSDFNGANQDPISEAGHWAKIDTNNSTDLIRTGNAAGSNSSVTGESYWTVQTFGPNVEVWTSISVMPGSGNNIDVSARIQSPGGSLTYDGYRCRMLDQAGTDQLQLVRVDNAVPTNLGTALDRNFSAGEMIGLRCVGNSIEGWYFDGSNWILGTSATDTTYAAAGNVAIHVRGTTGRANDIYAGTISGDAPVFDTIGWPRK